MHDVICSTECIMQRIKQCAGRGDEVTVTNASWRLLQWMSDYADLMRMLRADSGKVYSGCCELFELYFLHVYHTFSDVPLAELASGRQTRQVHFSSTLSTSAFMKLPPNVRAAV